MGANDLNYSLNTSQIKLDSFFYKVNCFSNFCSISDKDDNAYMDIPVDYFNLLISENKPLYHHKDKIFKGYSHFLLFENSIFENLKKGVKNEKSNSFSFSNL